MPWALTKEEEESSPSFSRATFPNFPVFLIYLPKRPSFGTKQSHAPNLALQYFHP
jgi:hypothetical protein